MKSRDRRREITRQALVRSMDPNRREHFVYRCFDAEGRLLYVGCSRRPEARLREHRYSAQWTNEVASVKFAGPYTYKVARDIEREATRTEDPMHNGFTPRNLQARLESRRRFDEVYETAMAHGETPSAAALLARIAVSSEEFE